MPAIAHIDRDEIAAASEANLGAVYSSNFAKVSKYFLDGWQSLAGVQARADQLIADGAFDRIDRGALSRAFRSVASSLGASEATFANAKRLSDPQTLCVVTGQQACLGGGPLYVLAKVAHTIALAKKLDSAGTPCVPIFWAASEDHDIDEANLFTSLSSKGKVKKQRIKDLGKSDHMAVESLRLPAQDHPEVQAILSSLPLGPRREEALKLLREGFGDGASSTFGAGICRILLRLFAEDGLLVIEPRHLRKFQGFQDVVSQEFTDPRKVAGLLERKAFELRELGFNIPLTLREYMQSFTLVGGRRRHLFYDGKSIEVFGENRSFANREELLARLKARPEAFSTGVALRPIVQQATLPCLAYVGGPGEIAYHALVNPLCEEMGFPRPLLLPRWSFLLSKQGAMAEELRAKALNAEAASKRASASGAEAGLEIRAEIRQASSDLETLATVVERDLERLEGRVDKTIKELRGRIAADPLQHVSIEEEDRQAIKVMRPGNVPQERALSWLSLWPEWGGELLPRLRERDPFDFSQEVISPS